MTFRRKSLLIVSMSLVLVAIASIAFYSSHRVAFFARRHLGLDLTATPFGSTPADISNIAPDASKVPRQAALVWYSAASSGDATTSQIQPALCGFSNGRLAEIRVTTNEGGSKKIHTLPPVVARLLYSLSPRLLYALRGTSETGEFRFADSPASLQSESFCNPVTPFWRTFTITSNSQ